MATETELMELLDQGDELADGKDFSGALELYRQVWDATKATSNQVGSLANMVARSIARTLLDAGRIGEALKWIIALLESRPPKDTSSYILAGCVFLEAGDEENAMENFGKAFALGKKRAFQGRDPKYLRFYINGIESRRDK